MSKNYLKETMAEKPKQVAAKKGIFRTREFARNCWRRLRLSRRQSEIFCRSTERDEFSNFIRIVVKNNHFCRSMKLRSFTSASSTASRGILFFGIARASRRCRGFCWLIRSYPRSDLADFATIWRKIAYRKLFFLISRMLDIILDAVDLVRSLSSSFPYLSINLRK